MTERQNTIWERFLSPVVGLLIDEEGLQRYALSINWEKESDRFQRADVIIPAYYSKYKFRGIEDGYLNPQAVVSYDPVIQYLLPPNETLVRGALIDTIKVKPRRILDLGCGTGSTTLMLKQAFPQAEVIGLDLSPYMLVRAEHKATSANLNILWRHGNAEKTAFPAGSFDLITASLLLREIPDVVSQAILQESFRLLVVGGQVLILDSNQKTLRQLQWLKEVFEEPYLREYAALNVDESMGKAGFKAVQTEDTWWMHQVTSAVKPISTNVRQYVSRSIDNNDLEGLGSPAFGCKKGMSLKAVLFDFNGVIINDESIHLKLIDDILIQENLQPQRVKERQASLGRSDRACFGQLLANRGRVADENYLTQLLYRKAQAYTVELAKIEKLPLYPGVEDLIFQVRSRSIDAADSRHLKLGLVSGAIRQEIELVLHRAKLSEYFKIIVAGDDITTSKPEPDGYLLAVKRLNEKYPDLNLQPQECLAIEDTPAGIAAAKRAQMQVVGVANTYPFHMLQRCCNWTVDYLSDLELERVQKVYSQKQPQPSVTEC